MNRSHHHGSLASGLVLAIGVALFLVTTTPAGASGCHSDADKAKTAAAAKNGRYKLTSESYSVPDLILINQDAQEVSLASTLDASKPVAVNFIFTTCTTICPVMAATFGRMQQELGDDYDELLFVSISIDPEYDTPDRMKEYLEKFGAKPGWEFFTGTAEQITQITQAFNAVSGSKMNHRPLTFFKAPGDAGWIRIDGLASASSLVAEYRTLVDDSTVDNALHTGGNHAHGD